MFYRIKEFQKIESETSCYTKFGGMPLWINDPQIPISKAWGKPMMFIGQIALHEFIQIDRKAIAYIFCTHPESVEDDFFDPDISFYDSGENAIIIQWENESNTEYLKNIEISSEQNSLPIAYTEEGENAEYSVITERCNEDDIEKYRWDNRILGKPIFAQREGVPMGYSKLLLQFNLFESPLCLEPSDSILYVFLDEGLKEGKMMIE